MKHQLLLLALLVIPQHLFGVAFLLDDFRRTSIEGSATATSAANRINPELVTQTDSFSDSETPNTPFTPFMSSLTDSANASVSFGIDNQASASASAFAQQESTVSGTHFEVMGRTSLTASASRDGGPPNSASARASFVSIFDIIFRLDIAHNFSYSMSGFKAPTLTKLSSGENMFPTSLGAASGSLEPGTYELRIGRSLGGGAGHHDPTPSLNEPYGLSMDLVQVPEAGQTVLLLVMGLVCLRFVSRPKLAI